MNKAQRYFSLSLCALLIFSSAFSQSRKNRALESKLFDEEEILDISLNMNIKKVTSDIVDRNDHYALLTFYEDDQPVNLELKVKIRGKTRANPKVCSFPPIQLNFKKKGNYENLFAGQDKLKLVTHCMKGKTYDQYVLQEYLTYKHYSLLTDYSFKVRLLKVTYIDSADQTPTERFGFLIEDQEIMAKRKGQIVRKDKIVNQDLCNEKVLNIMTVFQYMIGNVDWSIPGFHNIKLIANDSISLRPIPIPYDFDYSGAISAHYAIAPESLSIENVRTRLFRGFCRQPGLYEEVFELFNEKKEEIYALYEKFGLLSEGNRKSTLKYFDQFYKTINDPKKAKLAFNGACRLKHKHIN